MKKRIVAFSVITMLAAGSAFVVHQQKEYKIASAYTAPKYSSSMPTTINLNDNADEEIRSYYSSLNSFSQEERKGTNLLKNLKPILSNNMVYYNYGSISSSGVTQIYTITDRDWVNSPATSIVGGTYNSDTGIISNYSHSAEKDNDPYIKMLYVDYELTGPTHFLTGTGASFDKEHVWSQSHGFKDPDSAKGPAGTDLHHLIAGEKTVNQQYHSNWSYGEVDDTDPGAKIATSETVPGKSPSTWRITGNKLGKSKYLNPSLDENIQVFEPNDSDKGRIARALLYMVAMYNNYSGTDTITQYNPNLELVDYIIDGGTSVTSSASISAKYGILSVLLKWNREHKPDKFEIHRNNLVYNNYQHNRNPFIDFPQWADYVWGESTSYASPSTDSINDSGFEISTNEVSLLPQETFKIKASGADGNITWAVTDSTVASINKTSTSNNEEMTITALKSGATTLKVTATCSGLVINKQVNIKVKGINHLSVSGMKTDFKIGEKFTTEGLKVTVHYDDNTSELISSGYTVSEPDMNKAGKQTVIVTYKTFTSEYEINIDAKTFVDIVMDNIVWIAVGAGVLLVAVVVIVYVTGSKKTKKKIKSVAKKAVKSQAKKSSKKK